MRSQKLPTKTKQRIIVRGVLVCFLFLFSFQGSFAVTIEELQAKLNALRQKDLALQKESQKYRSLINDTKEEIRTIKGEISDLTYSINGLEAEIQRTENSLELTSLEVEKLTLEIQKILDEIRVTKDQTSQALSKMYQAEGVSQIELVLAGDNFNEFWDEQQYFFNFQDSLNTLLSQMELLHVDLSAKKEEQENYKVQLEALKIQKKVQQSLLDDQRDYQKGLLTQNEVQKKGYEGNLSNAEKTRRSIIEEILHIEEEVKRLHNFELYLKSGQIPPPGTKIFAWPTAQAPVTQGYGATAFARSGVAGYRFHNGIDIGGGIGTPVKVAAPGEIIGRNTSPCPNYGKLRNFGCQGGWGNWVAIKHAGEIVTLYAHLAGPSILSIGTKVNTGDLLGYIGSSGNVTGPHLHFSMYTEFFLVPKGGYPGYNPSGTLNPLLYL